MISPLLRDGAEVARVSREMDVRGEEKEDEELEEDMMGGRGGRGALVSGVVPSRCLHLQSFRTFLDDEMQAAPKHPSQFRTVDCTRRRRCEPNLMTPR